MNVQMMSDEYRGWAWTRAFLGLQADEIHVCGDPSAVPLLRSICAQTGDELIENEYERFKPLKLDQVSSICITCLPMYSPYSHIPRPDLLLHFWYLIMLAADIAKWRLLECSSWRLHSCIFSKGYLWRKGSYRPSTNVFLWLLYFFIACPFCYNYIEYCRRQMKYTGSSLDLFLKCCNAAMFFVLFCWLQREVELATNHKCCVVYGALPPETRTQQAKLFNDPKSGYDVLVASDAVGMGLNLNIRRVVFYSLDKFDGDAKRPIPAPQVKQIAGRAGRRGSIFPDGITTAFYSQDIPYLEQSLQLDFEPATAAGLFPVYEQVSEHLILLIFM